jgi:glycosyltransferase involved in cell wall biosynthesis
MKIVILSHPHFFRSESMIRFAKMLHNGMQERGHKAELWMPKARFFRIPVTASVKKWFGYLDQYIVFPQEIRNRLKTCPPDTLFVFTDHALGPWVPLLADRPHVIHCHDFLAQRSALGEIEENKMDWLSRQYQAFIRRGFLKGKYFISVSEKTRKDLHRFVRPAFSEVVYNGLNQTFDQYVPTGARSLLKNATGINLDDGYILHVGGNHWYKNRPGVIEIYNAWRKGNNKSLPLLMIGQHPGADLIKAHSSSPFKNDIHLLSGIDDELLCQAYAGASIFLFPSLAEGFGWPIAEAMASGIPVITTNEAPMTEVAGTAGFLVPRRPNNESMINNWAEHAAKVMNDILTMSPSKRRSITDAGQKNARRFDPEFILDEIEKIYKQVLLPQKPTNTVVAIDTSVLKSQATM